MTTENPTTEPASPWLEERNDRAEESFVEQHGHVNEITAGTVLEYDGWQWALVSELALDRDVPKLGFILLDEVDDYLLQRLESADGCRQHFEAVKHLCGSEHEYWTGVDYVLNNDVWAVLGPIHPAHRSDDSSQNKEETDDR